MYSVTFSASHSDQLEYNGDQDSMEQLKLQQFNFEVIDSTTDSSTTSKKIQTSIHHLPLGVALCLNMFIHRF